ncbi:MAG: ATP-binding protein [Rickettsiales bacterium]|nr:ATP-binding protein [Rickettsiales bacterium]
MEQASVLAHTFATLFPDPPTAFHGLSELLVNAIEHGNLGIGFEEKTALLRQGIWREEIDRRLESPQWLDNEACLRFDANEDEVAITISDAGQGFDWEPYLTLPHERSHLPNGRGIATARLFAFSSIIYSDNGTSVRCTQTLKNSSHLQSGHHQNAATVMQMADYAN